jgi:chaperone modulatory protein CbpM
MLEYQEFCLRAELQGEVLEAWIAAGWLIPEATEGPRRFSEADLARARLIRDLREDLGVNDEGVAVVLDLIDQVHGLRRSLRELSAALSVLPAPMRERIQEELRARRRPARA